MDSILTSIKKLIGIDEAYEHFDADIIIDINSALAILTQLGVGPENGLSITDKNTVWGDFLPESPKLGFVKSYVHLKVWSLFDHTLGPAAIGSIERQLAELEWRIQVEADSVEKE